MQIRTPRQIIETAHSVGCGKIDVMRNTPGRLIVLAILAGAYISLGGLLSIVVGYGFPGLTAENPAMQKVLSGLVFPLGLTLIVVLGGELFTGNNALLIPVAFRGDARWAEIFKNWVLVWLGNFVGALLFMCLLVTLTGLVAADPWHTAVVNIAQAKVSMPWLTVFLKAIGANWCVCLAIWLALSGKTLVEKTLGCWLPVAAFVILGFEHCIANMFFIPCGMAEGAEVTIVSMFMDNLFPATLGNIVGGALFVGALQARLYFKD